MISNLNIHSENVHTESHNRIIDSFITLFVYLVDSITKAGKNNYYTYNKFVFCNGLNLSTQNEVIIHDFYGVVSSTNQPRRLNRIHFFMDLYGGIPYIIYWTK